MDRRSCEVSFDGVRLMLMSVLAVFCFSACSSQQFLFAPAGNKDAPEGRRTLQAYYPFPPDTPKGNIRVSSAGVVDLRKKGETERMPAIHLRMKISNQSDRVWTVNAPDQSVSFAGGGQINALYANSDTKSLPALEVKPGDLRNLDLFFPLPDGKKKASDFSEFDFHWKVRVGDQVVAESTSFDRIPRRYHYYDEEPYPYGPYYFGVGADWWWGPPVYYGPPGIQIRK